MREAEQKLLKIRFMGREKEILWKPGMKVSDVIKALGLTPDICVVVKNGEVSTEDEKVSLQDEIKVIVAISGG